MFHVAFPRGQGPVFPDLPPTLLPCAVAISAPPSDHLRAATFSSLIYGSLVAAMLALSSLSSPLSLVPLRPPDRGPTVIYEPQNGFRVTLPQPAAGRTGGGTPEATSPAPPALPTESPAQAPAGLPTENHAMDPVATGSGGPGAAAALGPPSTGTALGSGAQDFTAVGLAVLRQVDPVYPDFARKARIQGPVVLLMTVDEGGQPIQVQVLEGHPAFHEAAKQAARQWRFEPARMNGRPVSAAFRLTIRFSLK